MARLKERFDFENGALAAVRDAAKNVTGAYQDAARGLDALEYGLCCHESWDAKPAVIDADGAIVDPAVKAGDIWTLRYDEAFAFEAAWNRRELGRTKAELNDIKARLAALEAK